MGCKNSYLSGSSCLHINVLLHIQWGSRHNKPQELPQSWEDIDYTWAMGFTAPRSRLGAQLTSESSVKCLEWRHLQMITVAVSVFVDTKQSVLIHLSAPSTISVHPSHCDRKAPCGRSVCLCKGCSMYLHTPLGWLKASVTPNRLSCCFWKVMNFIPLT